MTWRIWSLKHGRLVDGMKETTLTLTSLSKQGRYFITKHGDSHYALIKFVLLRQRKGLHKRENMQRFKAEEAVRMAPPFSSQRCP